MEDKMKIYPTRQIIVRSIFDEPIIQKHMKDDYTLINGEKVPPFEVWSNQIRVQLKDNNRRYYTKFIKRMEAKHAVAIQEVEFEKGNGETPSVLAFHFTPPFTLK